MKPATIAASEFKAKCLRLLDQVADGSTFIITKHGRPVARVTPVSASPKNMWGSWRSKVKIAGDIVNFNEADDWENA